MMSASPHGQDDWEVSPPERLDDAFAVLRALPATALVWAVAGPVPMVLALLFFWSDMTRGGRPALTVVGWAVALAVVYGWLKVTQAFFARAVWARLLPEGGLPVLTMGQWFRRTGALLAVGSVSLPMLAVSLLLVLPFVWVFGFFHHATVLAYTQGTEAQTFRRLIGRSARLTHHEPLAHHFSLLLLTILGVLIGGAVFVLGLLGPYLLKVLTGMESEFTRNPLAVALNPFYLSVVVSVAWMLISPYFRVAYVLRTFHVVSRRTGDDLLGRLEAARKRAVGVVAAAVMVLLSVSMVGVAAEPPAESVAPTSATGTGPSADSGQFTEAIRSTLASRDYQWRLPRAAGEEVEEGENALLAWIKSVFNSLRDVLRDMGRLIDEAGQALRRLLGGGTPVSPMAGGGEGVFTGSALRGVLYLSVAVVVVGLLAWVVYRWRRRHRVPVPAVVAGPAGAPVNLADEATLASALPEDEWLRLARAQCEGGDLRLAVRAVFLATLATLGEQRLIDIARSKSNRDYAVELRLRAAAQRGVPEVFGRSVSVFERAWYGLHEVAPDWVQELLDNHQRLSSRVPAA